MTSVLPGEGRKAPRTSRGKGKHAVFVAKEKARVEKALAKAQAVAKTAYHLTAVVTESTEDDLAFSRTDRGLADANHFLVHFNPFQTADTPFADLVKLAGHEIIHGIWFRVSELAEEGKSGASLDEAIEATESATYTTQRALFGEVPVREG